MARAEAKKVSRKASKRITSKAATKKASAEKIVPKKPAISDAAVLRATGRSTAEWFKALAAFAKSTGGHEHAPAAAHLHTAHACPEWWSQMVTVLYERERGLRRKHERPDGYSISVSRTVPAPITALYRAWEKGGAWLPTRDFTVRTATRDRSIRITWPDGTSVEVMFYAKGVGKSQVSVQHGKHKSAAAAGRARAMWADALDALRDSLTP